MLTPRVVLGDRYQLDGPIGAGGHSEVWRAVDLILNRPVAVKLLYPGLAQRPDALARFRAEAQYAGRLNHPNIASVLDYVESPHPPFPVHLITRPASGQPGARPASGRPGARGPWRRPGSRPR